MESALKMLINSLFYLPLCCQCGLSLAIKPFRGSTSSSFYSRLTQQDKNPYSKKCDFFSAKNTFGLNDNCIYYIFNSPNHLEHCLLGLLLTFNLDPVIVTMQLLLKAAESFLSISYCICMPPFLSTGSAG